jgi:vacuolar-type H+-ATPase subunit E/Vma4
MEGTNSSGHQEEKHGGKIMPAKKNKERSVEETSTETGEATTSQQAPARADLIKLSTDFAKELRDTTGDFVRKLSAEQQKRYSEIMTTMSQDMSQRYGEILSTGINLQKEMFSTWAKGNDGDGNADDDRNLLETAQKFWSDLATDLYERSMAAFSPENGLEYLVKRQESYLTGVTESYRKLLESYTTNTRYLSLFEEAMDAAAEAQRQFSERGGFMGYFPWIPSRKDMASSPESRS